MFREHRLDYADARELLDYIIEKAGSRAIAVAVVDSTGRLLAAASIYGVGHHYMDFAIAKAITALHEGQDTIEFRFEYDGTNWVETKNWSEWELTHASQLRPGFCGWAGGTIVNHPDTNLIVGAIGVSGLTELDDHIVSSQRPDKWA